MSIENRGIDDSFFNYLCVQWQLAPIHHSMDLNLTYLGPGTAGLKWNAGQHVYTTIKGRLQGGILATIADTAMGWAIITLGRSCVTVDMYINYLTPAFEENEIIAEGNIVHSGKRTVMAESTLLNNKGELIAKSRGTFSLKKENLQVFD
jgi:acyl-CoA thioesterase